jgi:hypothetical protein
MLPNLPHLVGWNNFSFENKFALELFLEIGLERIKNKKVATRQGPSCNLVGFHAHGPFGKASRPDLGAAFAKSSAES